MKKNNPSVKYFRVVLGLLIALVIIGCQTNNSLNINQGIDLNQAIPITGYNRYPKNFTIQAAAHPSQKEALNLVSQQGVVSEDVTPQLDNPELVNGVITPSEPTGDTSLTILNSETPLPLDIQASPTISPSITESSSSTPNSNPTIIIETATSVPSNSPVPSETPTLALPATQIETATSQVLTPTSSPVPSASTTSAVIASPTSISENASWSVEVSIPVSNAQVAQTGGAEQVKQQMESQVDQNLSDNNVQSEVIQDSTSTTTTTFKILLQGEDGIEQFKEAIYEDLGSQINLLSGPTMLSITGNVKNGEYWPLTLQTNPSTGYDWDVVSSDTSYLLVVSESQAPLVEGVGAPAIRTIRFKGLKDGQTSLSLAYRRPWEPNVQMANEITISTNETLSEPIDLTKPENPEEATATPSPTATIVVRSPEKEGQSLVGLPTSWDWRNYNGVTTVKNQGGCGSCWAFGTVGVMESALKRYGVGDIDLSEQYLVSCNNSGWSCSGGWWAHSYHVNSYMSPQTQAGAVLESDFPYTASNQTCSRTYNHPYRLMNWYYISGYSVPSETAIKEAIYNYGPISVTVCVGSGFQAYRGGIFNTNETSACGGSVNHAVVLTGWDDTTSPPSWVMKNSWGTSWGESGYMRLARSISNIGYAANYVVYSSGATPTLGPTPTRTITPTPIVTPVNNDINAAISISNGFYENTQDTINATTATDDPIPTCGGGRRNNTVWYRYTANGIGTITIDTMGSDYDSVLSVWNGTRGALSSAACDDDSGGNYSSSLQFTPTLSGQTYYIMVSSYGIGGGNLSIQLEQVPGSATIVWPKDSTVNGQPTFSWYSVVGATRYYLRLDGGDSIPFEAASVCSGSVCSASLTNPIADGNHIWDIQTWNTAGYGSWSTAGNFTVLTATPIAVGPGTYDDTNVNIIYSGSWNSATYGGMYNNTYHYSRTTGSTASLNFYGTQVKVIFVKKSNAGVMRISIDGGDAIDVNTYSSAILLQQVWASPLLAETEHTLTITHQSGSYIFLDAISITPPTPTPTNTFTPTYTYTPLVPVSSGTYDDRNAYLVFSGSWISAASPSSYAQTYRYSNQVGSVVEFTFSGVQAQVMYMKTSNAGVMRIFIDDNVPVDINQYSATTYWQQRWTSPTLTVGVHTIRIMHVSGTNMFIDALNVIGPTPTPTETFTPLAPVGAGTYDDRNANLVFSGSWFTAASPYAYSATYRYSNRIGSIVEFTFSGVQAKVLYTKATNGGIMRITIDDDTSVDISQYATSTRWQQQWLSPNLGEGTHTIRITHASGSIFYLDAITVFDPTPTPTQTFTPTETFTPLAPFSAGAYDDRNANLVYSGSWLTAASPYASSGTYRYSNRIGSIVEFTFSGVQAKVLYIKANNGGIMRIAIDNGTPVDVSQYATSTRWQQQWLSSNLGEGTHTIRITHASGSIVYLDAITVLDPTPTPTQTFTPTETFTPLAPVGAGTYDDRNANLVFSGSWLSVAYPYAYSGTYRYSNRIGSIVEFTFSGVQAKVLYTKAINGGIMRIAIDDGTPVSINQYAITTSWQQQWLSPNLNEGTHTIRITHASGSILYLDAITVFDPTPTPTQTFTPTETFTPLAPVSAGTYDDRNTNLVFSGSWISAAYPYAYSGTYRYSNRIGSIVEFTFSGVQAKVLYIKATNGGIMRIAIDNGTSVDVNQYATTTGWQQQWLSPNLGEGTHTIRITHASGSNIYLDAIRAIAATPTPTQTFTPTETFTPLAPIGGGTYDDRNANLVFSGSWISAAYPYAYSGTYRYSNRIGSIVEFTFSGVQAKVLYIKATNGGIMRIAIDNGTPVDVNQYATTTGWQQQWLSPNLGEGTHTIRITHASGSNIYLDAIGAIAATPTPTNTYTPLPPVDPGIYDDFNNNIIYIGTWNIGSNANAYARTFHYSSGIGSHTEFTFSGAQFSLVYTKSPTNGVMSIKIDDDLPILVSQYAATTLWQQRWVSGQLDPGIHTIRITHLSGSFIYIDAFIVPSATPTPTNTFTPTATYTPLSPVDPGSYDDRSANVVYTGSWTSASSTAANNGTFRYSTGIGSLAAFTFYGSQINVIYIKATNGGVMQVSIDGGTPVSISQYAASTLWRQQWASPSLAIGVHTIRLTHANGAIMYLDSFVIAGNPPQVFDDARTDLINYDSGWHAYDGLAGGPQSGTAHYSTVAGSTVTIPFSGRGIKIVYNGNSNRGTMRIQISGISLDATLNQNTSTLQWQREWNSSTFGYGTYTLTLTHQDGDFVDIDAIYIMQ